MKAIRRRTLSCMLLLALLCALLLQTAPGAAAATAGGKCGEDLSWTFDDSTGALTITGTGAMDDNLRFGYWSAYADKIRSVSLPEGLTKIGIDAFFECTALTEVTIPGSVREIGDNAFYDCTGLKKVTISEGVETICGDAFTNCKALTELTIPGSVKSVNEGAFVNCYNLKTLTIQKGVGKISFYAFDHCYALRTVIVLEPNCEFASDAFIGTFATFFGYPGSTTEQYARAYATSSPEPFKPIDPKTGFTDVPGSAYYAEPVAWAVERDITKGTSAIAFSPNATCKRAQVVTFLWRAAGSPEPEKSENPFADVAEDAYYYKAVLWAVENGITSGTGETAFSPDSACTRAQVVTFLWRAAECPPPETAENPFVDIADDQYYTDAVLWAVKQEITKGTGADRFSPGTTCTRGQIVTFLYRNMK